MTDSDLPGLDGPPLDDLAAPRFDAGGPPRTGKLKRRGRRSWIQRATIACNVLLVFACLAGAGVLAYTKKNFEEIGRFQVSGGARAGDEGTGFLGTASATEPQNFLLVGVDDDTGLDASDPVRRGRAGQQNTDTIMIMRIDPVWHGVWVLSLPRDLYVTIPPGKNRKDRINSSLATGGPELLINTIWQNFQIPVNHYVQVNFSGFKQIVDLLDGVPIFFPWPARDQNTGLFQFDPGCSNLQGDQALAFVRSRYFETRDEHGNWQYDSSSDFGRMRRQQEFMRAALKKAIDRGARNPKTLNDLVQAGKGSVTLDDKLTIQQLLDLGQQMKDFDPNAMQVYQPPVRGFTGSSGAALLQLQEREAQPMLDIFRGRNPLADARPSVRVEVHNGTGRVGQGQEIGEQLKQMQFTFVDSFDSNSFRNSTTRITYATEHDKVSAVLLARFLDLDVPIEEGTMQSGSASVALIIGSDFTGFRSEPRPLSDFADYLPPEAGGGEGTTSTSQAPTLSVTTSSIAADIPLPPEGTDCR